MSTLACRDTETPKQETQFKYTKKRTHDSKTYWGNMGLKFDSRKAILEKKQKHMSFCRLSSVGKNFNPLWYEGVAGIFV